MDCFDVVGVACFKDEVGSIDGEDIALFDGPGHHNFSRLLGADYVTTCAVVHNDCAVASSLGAFLFPAQVEASYSGSDADIFDCNFDAFVGHALDFVDHEVANFLVFGASDRVEPVTSAESLGADLESSTAFRVVLAEFAALSVATN